MSPKLADDKKTNTAKNKRNKKLLKVIFNQQRKHKELYRIEKCLKDIVSLKKNPLVSSLKLNLLTTLAVTLPYLHVVTLVCTST